MCCSDKLRKKREEKEKKEKGKKPLREMVNSS